MNKTHVQKSFDRAAVGYEKHASVQKATAEFLARFLQEKTFFSPQTILDIGAGTGFLTEQLLKIFPQAHYTLNDISPSMIAFSKKKFGYQKNMDYCVGDAEQLAFPQQSYDLIASSLTFQWFENLETALPRLWGKTKCLAFSTLLQGTFAEWEKACQKSGMDSGLHSYPSFEKLKARCSALNPHFAFFEHQTKKEFFKDAKEFVRSLKKVGANVPHAKYQPNHLAPIFRALPNGIEVNYEIFYALLLKE